MNLFRGKKKKPETPPGIDQARARVEELRRVQGMRGRAASMLVSGRESPPTAQRQVTGN